MSTILSVLGILGVTYMLMKDSAYICVHQGDFLMFYLHLFLCGICFLSILSRHRLMYFIKITSILCKLTLTKLLILTFPGFFTRDVAFLFVCHVCQQTVLDTFHIYQWNSLIIYGLIMIPWYMLYFQTIIGNHWESFYSGHLVGIVMTSVFQHLDISFELIAQSYL